MSKLQTSFKKSYFAGMYTLEFILNKLREYKPELQRKYPVSRLGVFGSYAREEATDQSDIDIAVEITAPMGLNFIEMSDEIEDLFGVKTDVVRLRSKSRIPAIFKKGYDICLKESLLCL
ncbi:MAG TPA: nucleotidyltransferase family protein [Segetibacter sp.]|nr:nucleotidyltransferase family protein [Segetibacter sp.]